jgi:REP element-mobilizing transposase RayT
MVIGYHVILSAYGFWLPNDPRGSWSDFVRAWELRRFGAATKVETRQSVAKKAHDVNARLQAKQSLSYPAVSFSGLQAQAIGSGFKRYVEKSGVIVWACAILPEHTHLVLARHTYKVEQVTNLMKGAASTELLDRELHPLADFKDEDGKVPSCWGERRWKVFLDTPDDVLRAIKYVERNPEREGKPRQKWSFVTPYRSPSAPR